MLTRRIPASGEAVPVIGLGTWQAFDVGRESAQRTSLGEVLSTFVALGGTLVDSSPMYGRAEEVVGDVAAALALRPRLFLATKVWTSGQAQGQRQMDDSLRKLQTSTIDLMQVHNLRDTVAHLDTLRAWKEQGRVRYLGVTHYTAAAHEALAHAVESHPLDFVQVNYSAAEREAEERLLPLALERGVAVIANRPFASGDLLQRLTHRPLPPCAHALDCSSWPQLLLKFVVSHAAITCAIPATSNVAHLRANMAAGSGRLPDERQRAQIAAAATT